MMELLLNDKESIEIGNQKGQFEKVKQFKYLGFTIPNNNNWSLKL